MITSQATEKQVVEALDVLAESIDGTAATVLAHKINTNPRLDHIVRNNHAADVFVRGLYVGELLERLRLTPRRVPLNVSDVLEHQRIAASVSLVHLTINDGSGKALCRSLGSAQHLTVSPMAASCVICLRLWVITLEGDLKFLKQNLEHGIVSTVNRSCSFA